MNYTDLYKSFENFTARTDDYLGALFINFYKCLPNCYRIYYDENQKLNYVNAINNFHKIRKNIKSKIDSRKLLLNLQSKNNLPIEIFCYSSHEYLVLGTDIPFMLAITITDDAEIANYYEELYCEYDKVNEIFEFIKEFFAISENEETVSFGIAAVDVSNSVYTTWYDYSYNLEVKGWKHTPPYKPLLRGWQYASSLQPEVAKWFNVSYNATVIQHSSVTNTITITGML